MFQIVNQCTFKCVNRSFTKWIVLCSRFNKLNPGVEKRLNLMDSKDNYEEYEDLDDIEYDFMSGNKLHDHHMRELQETKDMKQLKIVGKKYFKGNKGPNMLTWAEKEQLNYLHNRDPEEWTIEKLAQSFPVSQDTVKRILKANWKPENVDRILKHDETVKNNWKLFSDGKLEVDPALKRHLSQFTERKHILPRSDLHQFAHTMNSKPVIQTKGSEFSDIIESYNSRLGRQNPTNKLGTNTSDEKQVVCFHPSKDENVKPPPHDQDFFYVGGRNSIKKGIPMTLDSYREGVRQHVKKDADSELDRFLVRSAGNVEHQEKKDSRDASESQAAAVTLKERDNKLATGPGAGLAVKLNRSSKTVTVPDPTPVFAERIHIPKHKWKEGCTYKVHDCYYDDDGEFLYRVPGMVG